jgi:hypothetical protein
MSGASGTNVIARGAASTLEAARQGTDVWGRRGWQQAFRWVGCVPRAEEAIYLLCNACSRAGTIVGCPRKLIWL